MFGSSPLPLLSYNALTYVKYNSLKGCGACSSWSCWHVVLAMQLQNLLDEWALNELLCGVAIYCLYSSLSI